MNKNDVLRQVDQFLTDKRSYNIKKTGKSFTIKEEIKMKNEGPHKPTVEYLKIFMYENFATKEDIKSINNRIDKLENRMENIETQVGDIKSSINKILEIMIRNGMK